MPRNIIVGLFALLVALVLYTVGTWRAYRARAFSTGSLVMLWVAVGFDVLATTMMGMQIGGLDLRPGAPMLHTVLALLAMAGMVIGAAVATWAFSAKRGDVASAVSRWLLVPWALWVAVFVWGMMTRGAARMGG